MEIRELGSMTGKMTATQRKMLERRVKTSMLMADGKDKDVISKETGVSVRTVMKDVQWVIDNPTEIRKAGGKAPSKKTVSLYQSGSKGKAVNPQKGTTKDVEKTDMTVTSGHRGIDDSSTNATDDEITSGADIQTDDNTSNSQVDADTDSPSANTSDGETDDPICGTSNGNAVQEIVDEESDVDPQVTTIVVDQEEVITEELPVTMSETSQHEKSGDDLPSNEEVAELSIDTDDDDKGSDVDDSDAVDSDDTGDEDGISRSSSVMIGESSTNGLISVGVAPVSKTKTITEVKSLDTPDAIDANMRKKLESSRSLMDLPEEDEEDVVTYHARKIGNLVKDGVMNPDDASNRESFGKALKTVWSEVFAHKTPEDGIELDEWFQDWDDDVSLTDEEKEFQELSHSMKTEYIKARVREDRVMIVFIGLIAVLLVAVTLTAVGFNLLG